MTVFSHLYGAYGVQNSINYFIRNNLGNATPTWMTWTYGVAQPRTLNFNYPDQPLNFPSFSVTHHSSDGGVGVYEGDKADGIYKAIPRQGLMEVNCWTLEIIQNPDGSQSKNEKWMQQLQMMRDMVVLLFEKNRFIDLYDLTDPNNPTKLTAVARIVNIREATVLPDPNPAVKRIRILITYRWQERWQS